jgi:hypothetical protein
MTKEEKAKWDIYEAHKADALWEVAELKKLLESEPDPAGKAGIQKLIKQIEDQFEELEARLSERFGGAKIRRRVR